MFTKALECPEVAPKAMVNLALLYRTKANALAKTGSLPGAMEAVNKAAEYLDTAKPLLDAAAASSGASGSTEWHISKYEPLRLECHRLKGSILAGMQDMPGCETEFRKAVESFPQSSAARQALARVLDLQGKAEEAMKIREGM